MITFIYILSSIIGLLVGTLVDIIGILIFCVAYIRSGVKLSDEKSNNKHTRKIISLYFISSIVVIPVKFIASLASSPVKTGYYDREELVLALFLYILVYVTFYFVAKYFLKSYKHELSKFTSEEIAAKEAAIREYNKKRHKELSHNLPKPAIPEEFGIDEKNLPYVKGRKHGYGNRFNTFVVPQHSDCYHRSDCPLIRPYEKTILHRYEAMGKYNPCHVCKPIYHIDGWYKNYIEATKDNVK